MSTSEPSVQDLSPVVPANVEKEPMLLLDTTGSMSWPASATQDRPNRIEVVHEAIGGVVEALAKQDSQAAHEEGGGGLMTITFAGGTAKNIDDINPANLKDKWNGIQWGGGTEIMPGWNKLVDTFMDEFGSRPRTERPTLLALVITDGEASDTDQFAAEMAKTSGDTYVCIALLGYGTEHDQAQAKYQQISDANKNFRVVSFGGETDPNQIAEGLLSLIQ